MFSRYMELLNEKQVKNIDVSRATGIPASTFSDWKKGKSYPKQDKLQKIAGYFNVSVDWLLGNTDQKSKEPILSQKDERDIAVLLNLATDQLDQQEALMFDGEPLDEESKELLKASIENSLKIGKMIAKKKFAPNKYK